MLNLNQEVGSWDTVLLEPLTEDNFISNLHQRFKRDHIYTYIGNVLVSVNPYKKLALYSTDLVETYVKRPPFQLPPHIYGVAESAYRWLNDKSENQCIIVTGESGAGKTEAARIVLQFLVLVSGINDSPEIQLIKDRLVQANTLLEAFGNAKTMKNDNASRFGKFLDIEFDFKGDPIAGHLTNYFLDKARVTTLGLSDRNFHIFYQLLSGADIQLLKLLKLQRNVEQYAILQTESKHPTVTEEDDKKLFLYTKEALTILGFTSYDIIDIFKVLAVILKLGNLIYVPCNNIDGTDGCAISNDYELFEISELLSTDPRRIHKTLTTNQIIEEEVLTDLNAIEATKVKEILCRTLYSRLFTWLINRINECIKAKSLGKRRFLGVLDFYGFESFPNNNNLFEQLIINYCNEKLHQFMINICLKEEQEEIIKEGLEWTKIDFFNNIAICQLLEQENHSILSLLEEQHVQNDEVFLARLEQCCSGNSHYAHINEINMPNKFQIRHFAGHVSYKIDGFIEKSRENLPKELSRAMYKCDLKIMQELFPEGNPRRCVIKRPVSTSSMQIQVSLNALLKNLTNRQNHYIRCIKPNDLKQPKIFEISLVQHQIRYMCLLSTVQIWRSGYCQKMHFSNFLNRYKMICSRTWPKWRGSSIEGVSILLRNLPIPSAEFTFGRTKLFIRSPRTVFELEDFRRNRLQCLALLIQKVWRGYSEKKKFRKLRHSQMVIASAWKSWRARQEYRILKHRKQVEWAAKLIQRHYIQWKRRQYLLTLIKRLPLDSNSPLSQEWSPCTPRFSETNNLLKKIHHKWRCYKYRIMFDQTARNRMREKVTASFIFKDRKCSYPKSVSHPFLGDYVRLRQNIQWKKMSLENNDQYVVFADIVNKITRSSGKFVPILLVISTRSMLILDQRTLQIKYRIPANDIYRISLSPYLDDVAVVHMKALSLVNPETSSISSDTAGCLFQSDLTKKKGDFVFQTGHVIEIVTKLFLVVQNAAGKPPEVNITTEFEANFGSQIVTFTFKYGLPEVQPGQIKVFRRANKMEIFV